MNRVRSTLLLSASDGQQSRRLEPNSQAPCRGRRCFGRRAHTARGRRLHVPARHRCLAPTLVSRAVWSQCVVAAFAALTGMASAQNAEPAATHLQAAPVPAATYDTLLFRALTWRNIGP